VVAVLALVQAALGVLPALGWLQIGSDLVGRKGTLHPVFGVMLLVRGALIAGAALLYGVFGWGIFKGRARTVGFSAAAVNLVFLLGLVIREQFG
jgi:hypothetical protein